MSIDEKNCEGSFVLVWHIVVGGEVGEVLGKSWWFLVNITSCRELGRQKRLFLAPWWWLKGADTTNSRRKSLSSTRSGTFWWSVMVYCRCAESLDASLTMKQGCEVWRIACCFPRDWEKLCCCGESRMFGEEDGGVFNSRSIRNWRFSARNN